MKLMKHKDFSRFWIASTISDFGAYITTLALQVLVIVNLSGSATDVGWISASRWFPYMLLGLVAGVIIDRVNRKYILVVTDISRGILLILICLTAMFGLINIGWLIVIMMFFGVMSLFHDVASQSLVPMIVPRNMLTEANARLGQSSAVAETSGPALAGGIVAWIGAPFAILMNAGTYILSGIIMSFIKYQNTDIATSGHLSVQIKGGLQWVYRHEYLRTLALNTHVWFLFHSMLSTVFVTFAIIELGFKASNVGVVLSAAGIGAVLGTSLSIRAGKRFGIGHVMTFSRILYGPAVILIVLAPAAIDGNMQTASLVMVIFGQFLYGFGMGVEGPLEMSYRQSVTPASMQGRMNATMRSINRSMIVIGAPLGGFIADKLGFRTALWISIVGLAICGIWLFFSKIYNAQIEDHD
ncbi:MFS transporter [Paenisporosarcina sp. NPDC076898]|uniref:MFS transporter n=2 Tax=unclassified Paenisporosarcina TaxID=2642018 RepID=UPI003D05D50E